MTGGSIIIRSMLVVMSALGHMCHLGTPERIFLEWEVCNKAAPCALPAGPGLL